MMITKIVLALFFLFKNYEEGEEIVRKTKLNYQQDHQEVAFGNKTVEGKNKQTKNRLEGFFLRQ